MRTVLLTFFFR